MMRRLDPRILGTTWLGFTAYLVLLQYLFNETAGVFAIALSAIAAIPTALIIAVRARRRPGA